MLRKRKNLSQEKLSFILNVPSVYISKVERGIISISIKKLQDFAIGLGTNMANILMERAQRDDGRVIEPIEEIYRTHASRGTYSPKYRGNRI